MNIKQYMTANGYGSGVKLARDLGLSPAYLNQIANGHRMPSLKLASRIIKASNNQITLHGLRPDLELILREQGDGMESQHGTESHTVTTAGAVHGELAPEHSAAA